ncbi:MAG: LysR substrate-binding domain-containing protein [Nocardioides sp.]|uniref:LysR substrate-binding domain-containing protein n=1 Tax=Nocardioides sp. TaxID=35761 RepID=UPI0039E6D2FC
MRSLPALRVLCAVSAEGSFSAAAASLAITQSAVSQHVAALERHVGVELVVRGLRPVELTPAGQVLVAHGQAMVARMAAAERELDEVIGRGSRQLRLGSFPTALATFVPRAIARLRSQQPAVTVSITDDHMQGLLPRLHRRELDLAVVFAGRELGSEPVGDDLVAVPLFTDRYRVLLPLSHRLAARDRDPAVRELKADTWVGGGSRSSWFVPVRDVCRSQGFEPRVSLTSDDYLAVQAFVAAGLGVAVVPGLAAARHVAGVRVRGLRGVAPARHVGVAHPDSPLVPPTTAAFVQAVRAATAGRRRAPRDALAAAPR